MLRNRSLCPPPGAGIKVDPTDGGFQALDQMANWVRFADSKATILTAGFGVLVTMLITNAGTIASALREGCLAALVVGVLAVGAVLAAAWTLYWLVRAIAPQSAIRYSHLNRFAWPSLVNATPQQLLQHAQRVDVRTDIWQQVVDLSSIANRKFDCCGKAVHGFAALAVLGLACVAVATGLTG
ncbi:Pycsar system effector family protein [Janibacter indicus]|uniref:Pycsar effector protein domain-containing protein n=1 Tax=Janibacter indicus TaxID=857417 RepID=A0A1W2BH12_9MICO|nr:Pycsar system effector family protein [Janibacter indicus]SMC71758.1 hypothetical protein SAMN06296429_10821 [Janibacter indicus]